MGTPVLFDAWGWFPDAVGSLNRPRQRRMFLDRIHTQIYVTTHNNNLWMLAAVRRVHKLPVACSVHDDNCGTTHGCPA